MRRVALGPLATGLVVLVGCATLADGHAGLDNPPSARVGPFRLLATGEIGASQLPPFAMQDGTFFYRDPAVVDLDGADTTFDVVGYFAGVAMGADPNAPTDHIARFDALDGRSFQRPGQKVIEATAPWMVGHVGAPAGVRTSQGTFILLFETGGGIGVATSADGTTFDVGDGPVIDGTSPTVVQNADGTFTAFVEAPGDTVREATSPDGLSWTVNDGVALEGASSPCALLRKSEEGRAILDVYFTRETDTGPQIALASRFLDASDDALVLSPSIMLAPNAKLAVREPMVLRFDGFTLLFATENSSKTNTEPSVIAGLAPATFVLPAANPP